MASAQDFRNDRHGLEALERIIAPYEYGQYALLDRNSPLRIRLDPLSKDITIPAFYSYDHARTDGNCLEILHSAVHRLQEEFPRSRFIRAKGNDPHYFSGGLTTHFFILMADHDRSGDDPFPPASSEDKARHKSLRTLLDTDPLLIDPALKRIAPLSGSGYALSTIYAPHERITVNKTLHLAPGEYIPLALRSDGLLYLLGNSQPYVTEFSIGLQSPGGAIQGFPISHQVISQTVKKDPRIAALITLLKETPISWGTSRDARTSLMIRI